MCSAGESPRAWGFLCLFCFCFVLVQPQTLQWTAGLKCFISDLQLVSDALGDWDMGFLLQGTDLSPHPEGICQPSCRLWSSTCAPLWSTHGEPPVSLCSVGMAPSPHPRLVTLSCGQGSGQWPPQEWQEQRLPAMCTASPYCGLLFSPHEWSLNSLRHSREGANRLFP